MVVHYRLIPLLTRNKSVISSKVSGCSNNIRVCHLSTTNSLSNDQLRFTDQVAVVTGAGGGLGRAYALLLASRGAKVVVNDLGSGADGAGSDSKAADVVVNEIKAAGGEAVANYDSCEHGDKLVTTALEAYGKIDIVIANAGILRDKTFARISPQDWDSVHETHLRGSFLTVQAAWPHMRKQSFGRIILTSSVAGVYGNFGQANYSAAKLGLVGLSNTLSQEGRKYNINSNVIVPMAASRMTKDLLPEELIAQLSPDHIAPVVAWMCHQDCTDSGKIVEALAGWAAAYRWQRSQGVVLSSNEKAASIEKVRDSWAKLLDFEGGDYPSSHQEATMDVMMRLNQARSEPEKKNESANESSKSHPAVGFVSKPFDYNYNFKDVILYNLGIGASTKDDKGLQYLYEGNDPFVPIPSFAVIPGFAGMEVMFTGDIPGLDINLAKVLHGEHYFKILKPLQSEAKLTNTLKIQDILDKGKGMVLLVEIESKDESGEVVAVNQSSIFVVGDGGFGGPRTSEHTIDVAKIPDRVPDKISVHKTNDDQAALYRMSGDLNPLHINPEFAAFGGFSTPILHGLCSLGVSVRQIIEMWADNDPSKVAAVKVRFSKPVLPGQTLRTSTWKEGGKIVFQTTVVENGQTCLAGGWVEMTNLHSKL